VQTTVLTKKDPASASSLKPAHENQRLVVSDPSLLYLARLPNQVLGYANATPGPMHAAPSSTERHYYDAC